MSMAVQGVSPESKVSVTSSVTTWWPAAAFLSVPGALGSGT